MSDHYIDTLTALRARLAEVEKDERNLSDAYLRIRRLVGAWNTASGGTDRFKVTEKTIKDLIQERDALREALEDIVNIGSHAVTANTLAVVVDIARAALNLKEGTATR